MYRPVQKQGAVKSPLRHWQKRRKNHAKTLLAQSRRPCLHRLPYWPVLSSQLHRTFIGGIIMMKQITAQEALKAHMQGKSVLLLGTEWNDSDKASCAIGGPACHERRRLPE